jgi:ABC-type molybdenum transport system ATPase subunit/photorepair protein PhrA
MTFEQFLVVAAAIKPDDLSRRGCAAIIHAYSMKRMSRAWRVQRALREKTNMRVNVAITAPHKSFAHDLGVAPSFRHESIDQKPAALRVFGLSKRYGADAAVSGLNFEIGEGEIFGLLGPNGAGKTTTIAMLATQRQPSAGDATLFGHSARKEPSLVRR